MTATPNTLTVSPDVEKHLSKFQDWLSLKPRSKENYLGRVRSFYYHTGRDTPITPESLASINELALTDQLIEQISCESDKYALKKYFDWLQLRAPSPDIERTTLFFKNKIDSAEVNVDSRDVGEKVLSLEKVQDLCRQVPSQMQSDQEQVRLMLQMMYETGTRISGMLWLEWQDVWREEWGGTQLDDTELVIHKKRSKSKKSGIVEMTGDTVERLDRHEQRMDSAAPDERVFLNHIQEDSAYERVYRHFKNRGAEIGVPDVSPHWFRHSRLTHLGLQMREEDKSYPEIKERLRRYGRHKSSETTEIYIKILKNRKAESISQYSTVSWEDNDAN